MCRHTHDEAAMKTVHVTGRKHKDRGIAAAYLDHATLRASTTKTRKNDPTPLSAYRLRLSDQLSDNGNRHRGPAAFNPDPSWLVVV